LCQNGSLSVFSSIRETEKSCRGPSQVSRVGGGRQSCCFWSNIPLWKRKCKTVHCHDGTASSFVDKVLGEVFLHFHAVAVKCHSSMRNWLCGLSGWWACSWLYSSSVSLFRSRWDWTFPLGGLLLCLRVITINPALITSDNPGQEGCIARGSLTKLLADINMLLLLISCQNSGRNRIRPDTQLQIKRRKKSACPPCCIKFCPLTPKIC
jgi:hypothetical protein